MDIIFIGQFVSDEETLTNSNYSQAANLYQNKFIRFTQPVIAISIIPVFINKKTKHTYFYKKTKFVSYPFRKTNIAAIIIRVLKETFEAFLIIYKEKTKNIWFYNLNKSTLLLVILLKFFTSKHLYVIIADYSYNNNNIFDFLVSYFIKKFDGAIVLNSKIRHRNSVILPGLLDKDDIILSKDGFNTKDILLSGSLGKTTGFEFALDFFSKYPQFNLIITGRPYLYTDEEFDSIIKKYTQNNKNIKYLGNLPYKSYKDVLNSIDIALSLREPLDKQHEGNFPSKILEYLSLGKMVISTIIYEDLDPNLYFYSEFNLNALKNKINELLNYSNEDIVKKKLYIYNNIIINYTKESLIKAINQL